MRRGDFDWLRSNRPLLISQIVGTPLVVAWLLYAHFHAHEIFGLVIVLLLPVFALANVWMISRARRRLSDPSARNEELTGESCTPAMHIPIGGSAPVGRWVGAADLPGTLGRMNASTPLGVLELSDRLLTLRVRPRFLASLFGAKPLVVSPEQVEAVFPARGRLRYKAIGIRPINQPPSYFLTVGADRVAILTAIASAQFPVEWDERRFSYA